MTPSAFRKAALALPSVAEVPHFERSSFRVGKKILATMSKDESEAMVIVKPRQRLYALLKEQPDVFFSHGGWTERLGALGVRLKSADASLLKTLLHESWLRIAPKRAKTSG